MRRAKIFQYPRAGSAQERNLAQRGDLALVDVLLIFLSPSLRSGAVQTLLCIAAKFAHDHRLVVGRAPGGDVQIGGYSFIPPDIFILSQKNQNWEYWVLQEPPCWVRPARLVS